ncbi:MAG: hypothetical protein II764_05520 [Bacteroidales bacterium]|nr:hypothetical protein [Bacteroidales bacterium]
MNKTDIINSFRKVIRWTLVLLVVAAAAFVAIRFFYVFADGVKAGELNQFALKGVVFKTYEGRLIQAGFKGSNMGVITYGDGDNNGVGSYVFEFSVTNKAVAEELMRCSGKIVELHYKEYFGALPWRGMQKHIVDKVVAVRENTSSSNFYESE